jgi:entericidin B
VTRAVTVLSGGAEYSEPTPSGRESLTLVRLQPELNHHKGTTMIQKLLTMLMLLGMLGTLSAVTGCNTIAGAGTDVERGGEAIHDTAKDVQHKM